VTVTLRLFAILTLILCGSFEPLRSAGPGGSRGPRRAAAPPARLVSHGEVWLGSKSHSINEIGRGKGIVFSPDLSEPGNREFYRALGFAYFEDPDWHAVLGQIRSFNQANPDNRIETLLVQSHGTNGDALKLQKGKEPDAPRSYIAPAALQENLEGSGVRVCLLAACNAGRLFRPENYLTVRADDGNRLFEPATLGIINASTSFDPGRSSITIVRRVESHIEVINECRLSELSTTALAAVIKASEGRLKPASRIAVPEMLIQLLVRDNQLRLVAWGQEMEKSRAETNDNYRERLISQFLHYVNGLTTSQQQSSSASAQAD
jgi:hypothetical protein